MVFEAVREQAKPTNPASGEAMKKGDGGRHFVRAFGSQLALFLLPDSWMRDEQKTGCGARPKMVSPPFILLGKVFQSWF